MHHNTKNSGSSNNFSQKNLGILPGGAGSAAHKASPIRESLIKNTGAFILGNGSNQGPSQGASSGGTIAQAAAANVAITHQPSSKQLVNQGSNYSTNQPTASGAAAGNVDLGQQTAHRPFKRDRSADRADFDYNDRSGKNNSLAKDTPGGQLQAAASND